MSHSSQNRPSGHPHYFVFFPRNMLKGVPKKYRIQSSDFLKKILGPIRDDPNTNRLDQTKHDPTGHTTIRHTSQFHSSQLYTDHMAAR